MGLATKARRRPRQRQRRRRRQPRGSGWRLSTRQKRFLVRLVFVARLQSVSPRTAQSRRLPLLARCFTHTGFSCCAFNQIDRHVGMGVCAMFLSTQVMQLMDREGDIGKEERERERERETCARSSSSPNEHKKAVANRLLHSWTHVCKHAA